MTDINTRAIAKIARFNIVGFKNFKLSGSDNKDVLNVSVWGIDRSLRNIFTYVTKLEMTMHQDFVNANKVAKIYLGMHTLQERNSDALDFYDVSLTSLSLAFKAFYTYAVLRKSQIESDITLHNGLKEGSKVRLDMFFNTLVESVYKQKYTYADFIDAMKYKAYLYDCNFSKFKVQTDNLSYKDTVYDDRYIAHVLVTNDNVVLLRVVLDSRQIKHGRGH